MDTFAETPRQTATHEQHIRWLRHAAAWRRPLPTERVDRAWQVARQAAQLLQQRYAVNRVRIFGSLLTPSQFHEESDVDLAVEGLAVDDYWDALADVLFLDETITVDLVDPDTCPLAIWEIVEREGVDIEFQPAQHLRLSTGCGSFT